MKRLLTAIAALLCINAAAQVQQEVAIVPNWNKGEVVKYKMTDVSMKITGSDTTDLKTTCGTLVFKVLKVTPESYKMSLTLKDMKYSDPSMEMLNEVRQVKSGDTKILYTVDLNGALVSVDNLEKVLAQGQKLLDPAMGLMQQEYGGNMSQEEYVSMYNTLKEVLSSPDYVMGSMSKYMTLFTFHGHQMKYGEKYEGESQVSSFVPGIEAPVTLKSVAYLDSERSTDDSVVAVMTRSSDGPDMVNALVEALRKTVLASGPMTEEVEEFMAEFAVAMKEADMSLMENRMVQVENVTGWPVKMSYNKDLDVTLNGVLTRKTNSREMVRVCE